MRKTAFISLIGLLAFQTATIFADPISDRITVTVKGTGPDVILIPGLASSGAVWDATVAQISVALPCACRITGGVLPVCRHAPMLGADHPAGC